MTTLTYEFYLQREDHYDVCELTFDFEGACEHEKSLGHAVIQSGDSGMIRSMIKSAISKISVFRTAKEEETRVVVDLVINTLEAIPLAVQDLASATTSAQVVGALMRAYKMFTHRNILTSAFDLSKWIFGRLQEVTKDFHFGSTNTSPISTQLQSGEFEWVITGARTILTGYKDLKNCALVNKLQNVLQYILSYGLFEHMGLTFEKCRYTEYESRQVKGTHHSIEGFIFSILETIVWMLERGMQSVKLGSFSPFLHSSAAYTKWADESYRILEDAQKIDSAPSLRCDSAHLHTAEEAKACAFCKRCVGLDEHEFTARLEKVIEQGEAMTKYATDAAEASLVKKMMRELRVTEARFLSKDRAQRSRKPPFTLLIHGKPKVAKTMFMDICFMQYGRVHDKDTAPECKWVRQSLDKFYSGYKPSKWCIVLDDVAMYNPQATPLDPTVADIIMLANGVPLVAPMAEANQKGIFSVRPDLLLASTNTDHLNASAYFSCPQAIRRRFPYVIDLSIKKEYADSCGMLDTSTVSVEPGCFQNVWHIEVKKLVVDHTQNLKVPAMELKPIAMFEEIEDFLVFFSKLTTEHLRCESQAQDAAETMRQIEICKGCFRPVARCMCDNIQTQAVPGSAEEADMDETEEDYDDDIFFESLSDPPITYTDEGYQRLQRHLTEIRLQQFIASAHEQERRDMLNSDFRVPFDRASIIAEEEMLSEDAIEDRRDYVNKALDWFDDQAMMVTTIAKSLALGVQAASFKVSEKILLAASDLMILYQVKRFKDKLCSMGQKIYDACCDWKVAGFCALLLSVFGAWKACSYVMKNFFGKDESEKVQTKVETLDKGVRPVNLKDGPEKPVLTLLEPSQVPIVDSTEDVQAPPLLSGKPKAAPTEGVRPTSFKRDEKPNVWQKDEIILSSFQVPSKSRGWAQMSQAAVKEKLLANVVSVKFEYEGPGGTTHIPATAACVAGHVYMTNNHCIPKVPHMKCFLSQCPSTCNINPNVEFVVSEKMIFRIPEKDIAFFWCMLPPKADLSELFMSEHVPSLVCNGAYIHCRWNENSHHNDIRAIRSEWNKVPLAPPKSMNVYFGSPQTPTIFGDCGSPLIGFTPLGPVILGIHQQLSDGKTGANQVLAKDIQAALQFFGPQVQCGEPALKEELGALHHKSVLHWPNEGRGNVYGSTPRSAWRQAPKSRVVDTHISKAAQAEGFVKRCGPPAMKGPNVWFKNIEPVVTQKNAFDKGVLERCAKSFSAEIIKGLAKGDLAEMVKLDDKTTLNGYPGVKYIDKINRNTSMGYPYRKSKKNFLVPCDGEDIWSDAMEYVEGVQREIDFIRDCYKRGERYMPVFIMSLKDEPTPFPKIQIEKTRGFMGGPAAWQHVVRQQLLTFVRIFQSNPYLFEGAPGMDCGSCSWQHLYHYLTKFGVDRLIAGDYGKYDKRMDPIFILAAFDVIIEVLKAAGRSEEDLRAIRCIAHDVAYPLTDVQGDFIEFFGSNPSGHALTVIINCIANSLYMRYVFLTLNPKGTVEEFKKYVALITYGDDNTMGVSEKIPWFNHTSISECLAKYGVEYTMADKSSESREYIPIEEVTFLKRSFVPREDIVDGEVIHRVACPLDWQSIDKMLTTCTESTSVCPEEQAIQSIRSAVGEFFYYGREVFEENVIKMKRIVANSEISQFVEPSTFPTYDSLLRRYADDRMCCDHARAPVGVYANRVEKK